MVNVEFPVLAIRVVDVEFPVLVIRVVDVELPVLVIRVVDVELPVLISTLQQVVAHSDVAVTLMGGRSNGVRH